MAVDATTTRCASWERAIENLTTLNQRLEETDAAERDALERAIVAQEEDLLDTPAPSFSALAWKIEAVFGELLGLDAETEAKRLILEDLADLIAESRQLLGRAA